MKSAFVLAAIAGIFIGTPAFAAQVSASFENLGSQPMTPGNAKSCTTIQPALPTLQPGQSSAEPSRVDCGGVVSTMIISYNMGTKSCGFNIETTYTPPSPLITGSTGYWTPTISAHSYGGATCKIVKEDISQLGTTGAFAATFSMK